MFTNCPLVSIIIPVFNVQQYLNECVDSVLNQTYSNIEVILLNDGSSDNSLDICFSYAKKDSRVIVDSHENVGLGPTRNIGMKLAHGDYFAFVDSDDYLENNGIEILLKKAQKEDFDIVQGLTLMFDESCTSVRRTLNDVEDLSISDDNFE